MALDEHLSLLVRESAMKWLDQRPSANVDFSWLSNFEYDGQRIPLMDRQRGIRKPAILDEALSIRTVFTDPRATPPYDDAIGPDGLQRYKSAATTLSIQKMLPCVGPANGNCRSFGS